jgi:uncharacterized protein YgbK (DUF1537 family)
LSASLHILADDLTGALDSAAAFAPGVLVYPGRPGATGSGTSDVEVVATATRDIAPDRLPGQLAPCVDWLTRAPLAFKKIDSLLRGNTFDEVALLMRSGAFDHAVFAPAFPAQGRITRAGRAWLQRADDAPQPLVAGSLVDALSSRGLNVAVDLPQRPEVGTVWVPDVASDADLQRVIDLARSWPRCLWCGSAGLAQAWASSRATGSATGTALAAVSNSSMVDAAQAPEPGPVLLISASHHAVSREQWARLHAARPDAITAQGGDDAQLDAALQALLRTPGHPQPALFSLAPTERLTPEAAAALLARQVDHLCRTAPRPRHLVVVGGDTLLALCRGVGAQALRSRSALARSGWGCASLVGGRWHGVVCHSRSGAFGTPDDLVEVVAQLMGEAGAD